jgi:predicted phage terminase large subunit-like protein
MSKQRTPDELLAFVKSHLDEMSDDEASALIRHALREKCLTDLYFLNTQFLGFTECYEPFHRPVCEFIQAPGRRKLILLPRDHFKTSIGTVGYSVQCILRDPDVRILVANATEELAADIVGNVQYHFKHNDKLLELFPEFRLPDTKSAKGKFTVPNRTRHWREATMESCGTGSNIVGRHYDRIFKDDLVNLDCLTQPSTNLQVKNWDGASEALLNRQRKFPDDVMDLVIGTRWGPNDLYNDLIESGKYETKIFGLKNEESEYYFPTRFDADAEEDIKQKLFAQPGGRFLFFSQYYNIAINPENQMFRDDMFVEKERTDVYRRLQEGYKYVLIDPAQTTNAWSDPTAIVVVTVCTDGIWLVHDMVNRKTNPDELVALIYEMCNTETGKHKDAYRIIMEQSGLQNTYRTALKMYGEIHGLGLPSITKSMTSTKQSKEARIDSLQPLFEQGRVWFIKGTPHLDTLRTQLLQHRNSPKHDDLMDALASAVPFAKTPTEKREVKKEEKQEGLPPLTMKRFRELRELQRVAAMGGLSSAQRVAFEAWS